MILNECSPAVPLNIFSQYLEPDIKQHLKSAAFDIGHCIITHDLFL